MRRSLAVFPIVLFFPLLTARATLVEYENTPFAPQPPAGTYAPGIQQGIHQVSFLTQCGGDHHLEGRFRLPRRSYQATLLFSEDCDIFAETEAVEEGPEAKFSLQTQAGLRIYRVALRMVSRGGHSYARSFCGVDDEGRAEVPFGAVEWQDEGGLYRYVPGLQPGDRLEEGEQTAYLIPDEDLGPDCWMVVCVRGRGIPCRIPFP